jgi:hypothetical protein
MKTKIEIHGYEIEIEEADGLITVKAGKDDETIEEFSLQVGEEAQSQGEDMPEGEDDIKGFGDFSEEEDFDGLQEEPEGNEEDLDMDDEMSQNEPEEEGKLESFQAFINKRK